MFRLTAIHQIEMTSRCNLRCTYCAHPKMPRPKIDMDDATYRRALKVAGDCVRARPGTIDELNLAGIGESTMHPEFVRNVFWAREAVGWDVALVVATNGILVTREMVKALKPVNPAMFVSMHRPEKAGPAIELLKEFGLLHGVSADPSIASVDWAGQVKWHVSAVKGGLCPWVTAGRAFVMADGRVSRCCFDSTGIGVFGTIWDEFETLETSPYSLCRACHLNVGVAIPDEVAA